MTHRLYIVLSDVHVPYQDCGAINAVCELMRDIKPEGLVLNGDIIDLIEVSRHNKGSVKNLEGKRLKATFDAGNAFLDQLHDAAPKLKQRYFIGGNHESRLARWIASGENAVFDGDESVDIAKRLRLKERGFKWDLDDGGHIKLGHLYVTHGCWTNKFHSAAHLDRFRHSVLYGHTHCPQMYVGSSITGLQAAYGAGHLADPTSEAMAYAPVPNAWQQGFALVYVDSSGDFSCQLINLWDGVFYYAGKRYGQRKAA